MNEILKKKVKKYVITTTASLSITVGLLINFGFFSGMLSVREKILALSDAFTVPGIILLAISALMYVSSEGVFDGISYAGKFAFRALVPGMRNNPVEKYGDYKLAKNQKRITGYSCLFFVGVIFTFVGVIFTALFFKK